MLLQSPASTLDFCVVQRQRYIPDRLGTVHPFCKERIHQPYAAFGKIHRNPDKSSLESTHEGKDEMNGELDIISRKIHSQQKS